MKKLTIVLVLVVILGFVHCDTQAEPTKTESIKKKVGDTVEKVKEKVGEKLHVNERTMPEKAGEAAGSARETLEHAERAVKEGAEAVKSEGIKAKVEHAYEAVKEAVKVGGSAKDATIDTQKTPVEGAKDAAKEGVKVHSKHEDLKEKVKDAKQFAKEEINDAANKIKTGLENQEGDSLVNKVLNSLTNFATHALGKIGVPGFKAPVHPEDSNPNSEL